MKALNLEEIGNVIEGAAEGGHAFHLSVHGLESLDHAIILAEKIVGEGNAQISRQPGCYVVRAEARKQAVDFFVNRTPFD